MLTRIAISFLLLCSSASLLAADQTRGKADAPTVQGARRPLPEVKYRLAAVQPFLTVQGGPAQTCAADASECPIDANVRWIESGGDKACLVTAKDIKVLGAGPLPRDPKTLVWTLKYSTADFPLVKYRLKFDDAAGVLVVNDAFRQFPPGLRGTRGILARQYYVTTLRSANRAEAVYLPVVLLVELDEATGEEKAISLCAAVDPKIVND